MAKRKPDPAGALAPSPPQAEEYTVLARRYRPQQFKDLVGQEPVAQALGNALQSNRVAHAYLFTGARGVGKTSTARILAKALNCEKGPTPTPCDQCELCQAIASGDDIDVLEIDGASNRGIDEVREIRQNVQFRPSRARYKIYIIDEVHMLTGPAFNALLKTLEEPPPHVKFIFATTEVQKIPATILSRCQRFDFAGIGTGAIVSLLRQIVAREGRQADDEALLLIARRAAGSMRDAQSLLDQLLAFGNDRLTVEQVHRLLGTANEERVAALARAVLEKKPQQALELLAQAADQGQQLGELVDQLLDYWRDLLVVNCAGSQAEVLSVSGPQREALQKQAASLSPDTILAGLDVLVSTRNRLRGSRHGRILLEMALVRLGRLEELVSLSQLAQLLNKEGSGPAAAPGRAAAAAAAAAPSRAPGLPEAEKKKPASEVAATQPAGLIPLAPENVPLIWQQVHNQVGPLLASDLKKGTSLAISGPNTLVVRFPSSYNHPGNPFLDPVRLGRVEEALRKITGQACTLRQEYQGEEAAAASSGAPEESETPVSRSRRQREEALSQPLVRRAMEVLGAQIVHLEEDFGAALPPAEDRTSTSDTEES